MTQSARLSLLAAAALSTVALAALLASPAGAQVGGSLPSFVGLQGQTPGTPQAGNSNITGTAIANQFRGQDGAFLGRVTIGDTTPLYPLQFPPTLGNKISLYGGAGPHYGMGV